MQSLVDLTSSLAPEVQDLYLFAFFCLGFCLFRTQTARWVLLGFVDCLCGSSGSKSGLPAKGAYLGKTTSSGPVVSWTTVETLRSHFCAGRYDEVLSAWSQLETHTKEAMMLVANSLLVLGRPEDIGLFISKSVAHFPHLKPYLADLVMDISCAPRARVARNDVAAALRDVFDSVRDMLDGRALEVLTVALAKFHEEDRLNKCLELLREKTVHLSGKSYAAIVQGLLGARNFDFAMANLEQAFASLRTAPEQTALYEAAAEAAAAACPGPAADSARAWRVLTVLEVAYANQGPGFAPTAALVALLEITPKSTHQGLGGTFCDRCEALLRKGCAEAEIPLPAPALDALVRFHAGGDSEKAIASFNELASRASEDERTPSEGSLVGMLGAAGESENPDLAETILNWARDAGRCTVPVLGAAVKALANGTRSEAILSVASQLEEELPALQLDTTLYGQLIKLAVKAGKKDLAQSLYNRSNNPDAHNTANLIRACGQAGDLSGALTLLDDLHKRGAAEVTSFNSALDAAVCLGDDAAVERLLKQMREEKVLDAVSFNILLKRCGPGAAGAKRADDLLRQMQAAGFDPNISTYNSLLGTAIASGDMRRVWSLVDVMEAGPGVDAFTLSTLFKGQKAKRGNIEASEFDRTLALFQKHHIKVDEVLVNAAVEACTVLRDNSRLSATLELIRRSGWNLTRHCSMHTYATLIKAYGMTSQLSMARKLWAEVSSRSTPPSEQLFAQMVDVLVSNNCFDDAVQLFDELKLTHGSRGLGSNGFVVAWAMLIRGYARHKECSKAMECYQEMVKHGATVGMVVFNTLIDACSRIGDMSSAAKLYRDMVEADCTPDLITYSTLIKGYCVRGDMSEAMRLFSVMKSKGLQPDAIVFNSLLDGCAKQGMPTLCEQVIQDMERANIRPSNHSASILIKLYGRLRDVSAAFEVFHGMPRKYGFKPNAAVYTCLMATCISNDKLESALELLQHMLQAGERPDDRTFSTLLRGALRGGCVQAVVSLLDTALSGHAGDCRKLLDIELTQSGLNLIFRKKCWSEQGQALFDSLSTAGVRVSMPVEGKMERGGGPYNNARRGSAYQTGGRNVGRTGEQRGPSKTF